MRVWGLYRQLGSSDPARRIAAVRAIKTPITDGVLRRLLDIVRSDPDAETRLAAIQTVARLALFVGEEALRAAAKSDNERIASAATLALEDLQAKRDPFAWQQKPHDQSKKAERPPQGAFGELDFDSFDVDRARVVELAEEEEAPPSPEPLESEDTSGLFPQPPRVVPPPKPIAPPAPSISPPAAPAPLPKPIAPPPPPASIPQPAPAIKPPASTLPGSAIPVAEGSENVHFSCYYPREIAPNVWQSMAAYVYRGFAAAATLKDAEDVLGARLATMRQVAQATQQTLPEGAMITATPYLEGFQFNPPSLTIGLFENWQRFDFKLRAVKAPLYVSTNGLISFSVEGLIIAQIPLSVFVAPELTVTPNSATGATLQKLYTAIFCSYSRDDRVIIDRVERAYKVLGFDFLRDVHTLKSGQEWNDGLYDMIKRADIFQLFWSKTAADSPFVEREWRYALSLDRDETNFIRPVYWEEPIPPVPDALSHIHFAFEPQLDD